MNNVNLKILADIDCNVYVDNELAATAKKGQIEIIPLQQGEYWVQCICTSNPNYKIEQVVSLERHKIVQLCFVELIDKYPELAMDCDFKYCSSSQSYINVLTGKNISQQMYEEGENFTNGVAKVRRNNKWGSIDILGREIIPCIYYDASLTLITPCIYDYVSKYGALILVKKNDRFGFIDKYGNEIISHIYERVHYNCDLICVFNGKWGILNENGKEIAACIYDEIADFPDGGTILVKKNRKWGHIDTNGNIITPCIYDDASYFSNGIALVKSNGKWGIINMNCDEITPFIYDNALLSYGVIWVCKNKAWGIIDVSGNEIISCVYDEMSNIGHDLIRVKKYGKWGIINIEGRTLVPCIYEQIEKFNTDGLAVVSLVGECGNCKKGLINNKGRTVVPCIYDFINPFKNGFAKVEISSKKGIVNIDDVHGNKIPKLFPNSEITTYGIDNIAASELYTLNLPGIHTFILSFLSEIFALKSA